MASSVTVVLFSVMCLILVQNLVYSKPAPQTQQDQNTNKPANDPQPGPNGPPSGEAPTTVLPQDTPTVKQAPQGTKTDTEATTKAPVKSETTTVTPTPAPQTESKKDGSAVVYANVGLLVIAASVIMRL